MIRRRATGLYLSGLVLVVAVAAQWHAATGDDRYDLLTSDRAPWWTLLAGVLLASAYALGLPETPRSAWESAWRSLLAFGAGLGAVSLAQVALASPLLPRSSLLGVGIAVPVWSALVWLAIGSADRRGRGVDRVMAITGDERIAQVLIEDVGRRPEVRAVVVATLTVDQGQRRCGADSSIASVARDSEPTVIVLDTTAQADPEIVHQVAELHQGGARVRSLALFYEGWLGKLPLPELERVSLLFDIGELHRTRYTRAKRVVDLMLAAVGSVVLAVVIPLVWVANLIGNRGALFFRQERVGKGGRIFTILKFRTMASSHDSRWTDDDDVRVTSIGRLLRRSHIDELPQVLNILRGDLSTVGPRPEQVHYVAQLRSEIPFYDVRHLVRPGLTGWAQVKQGYAASGPDAYEKLQYDFFYLRRQSLVLDLRIVWRTLRDVMSGGGR